MDSEAQGDDPQLLHEGGGGLEHQVMVRAVEGMFALKRAQGPGNDRDLASLQSLLPLFRCVRSSRQLVLRALRLIGAFVNSNVTCNM